MGGVRASVHGGDNAPRNEVAAPNVAFFSENQNRLQRSGRPAKATWAINEKPQMPYLVARALSAHGDYNEPRNEVASPHEV